jgi:hypothetical protein
MRLFLRSLLFLSVILIGFCAFSIVAFFGLGASGVLNFGPNAAAGLKPWNSALAWATIIIAPAFGIIIGVALYLTAFPLRTARRKDSS